MTDQRPRCSCERPMAGLYACLNCYMPNAEAKPEPAARLVIGDSMGRPIARKQQAEADRARDEAAAEAYPHCEEWEQKIYAKGWDAALEWKAGKK